MKARRSATSPHGIRFEQAVVVFIEPDVIDFDASNPADGEVRRKAVGAIQGRLFTIVYTERGGVVRVISARRCNSAEARRHGAVHPRSE